MTLRTTVLLLVFCANGCGGAPPPSALPDESGDLLLGAEQHASRAGTTPAGPDLAGTHWRFVEGHCTEAPLDLSARGFEQELSVLVDAQGLVLVYDQAFIAEQCTQTVVQRARPPAAGAIEWTMIEEVRVAVPANDACEGRREAERPGEVRRAGEMLEVLVQRSSWCGGYEVRMVYAPLPPATLSDAQVVRHYVAYYNRRDAARIAGLFATSGSLIDPFTVSATGQPTRFDGREAVQHWFDERLTSAPWVALRLEGIDTGDQPGQVTARWQYMDPRLEEPLSGSNRFTIAVGEIFESELVATAPEPARRPGRRP